MKYSLFILILQLLIIQVLPSHAEPDLHIALKGGLDAATLDHEFRENRYDFSGGFAGYFRDSISERLSLAGQIELLYTPRGANVVFEGEKQAEFRYRYVDLVVAIRPEMRFGPMSMYLLLGGGLDLKVSATIENVSGSPQDITSDLHRIDVALLGGAGISVHLPRQDLGPFHLDTVFLEARHDIGLIDPFTTTSGFKNRTSSVLLGLSFAVGGSSAPAQASAPTVQ